MAENSCNLDSSDDGVWYRITAVLDGFNRPKLSILENTTFRKLDLFPSSGEEKGTPTLLGPLERTNFNHWNSWPTGYPTGKASHRSRILFILKMEVIFYSEMPALIRPSWRQIQEDGILHIFRCFLFCPQPVMLVLFVSRPLYNRLLIVEPSTWMHIYRIELNYYYCGLKSCISLLENVCLRVPPCNLRQFSLFCACPSNKHCHSARCAYAANVVGKDLDIFALGAVSLNYIYAPNCK
jgi:hypothetical protein